MTGIQWDDYPQGMGESSATSPKAAKKPPKQTQIRTPKERAFFSVHRATAQDANLSFEARGLLFYLLSKPDDWIVQVSDLQREGKIGRDKANRLLKELRDTGYIVTEMERGARGTFENKVDRIYDVSTTLKTRTLDNHSSGNPQLHNIDIQETEETPKRVTKARARNPWVDKFVELLKYEPDKVTRSQYSLINKAIGQLKEKGYTLEDLPLIHAYCVKRGFSDFGAMALVNHAPNWHREYKANGNGHKPVPITDDVPTANGDHIYDMVYYDPQDGSYIGKGKAAFEIYRQRGGA